MSQLTDLLTKVKDQKLSKEQVEAYRDELIHLFSAVNLERAELKKKEAFFFAENRFEEVAKKRSDVAIRRMWDITPEGQRLIELEAYKTILPKEIDSLKSRYFSLL